MPDNATLDHANVASLRESEERFRRSFDDAAIGMTIIGIGGDILKVNQSFAEMIGYSESELYSMSIFDITHPDDRGKSAILREQVIAGGTQNRQEQKRYIRKDGGAIWCLLNRSVVKDDNGNTLYTIGQLQDITELKVTEAALQESEGRLLDYIAAAADRYWETDENHCFVYVSEAPPGSKQYPSTEMIGKTRWDLDEMYPDAPHWSEYRAIMDQRDSFKDYEYKRVRPNGTEFYIRTSGTPMFDSEGRFTGYRGVNREISQERNDKRIAEEQARQARLRLSAAMEGLDAGFILWDADDEFVYCNSYYREMIGETADILAPGMKRRDYVDALTPILTSAVSDGKEVDVKAGVSPYKENLPQSGIEPITDFDYQVTDGRWFRAKRQLLEDGSRIALHTDISKHKQVENLKDEFLALASHELRTPLTSIMGAVGLVKSGNAGSIDPEAVDVLEIAYRNCERLSGLVANILDLSKIEAGELEIEKAPVDIMQLVRDAIEVNAVFAEELGCTFMVAQKLPGAQVLGDSKRLQQVLTNLLSNAAKFSKKDGRIEISVCRESDYIRIAVKDHGIGIPGHFRKTIYERFSQVEEVDNLGEPGTGLGLSIAKDIVRLHGGSIDYESRLGEGTTFYVEFPEHTA